MLHLSPLECRFLLNLLAINRNYYVNQKINSLQNGEKRIKKREVRGSEEGERNLPDRTEKPRLADWKNSSYFIPGEPIADEGDFIHRTLVISLMIS